MPHFLRRSGAASAVAAAACALTLVGASSAYAAGVNGSAADARFTGSYYVTRTAVKVNGKLTDLGSHDGGSAVWLRMSSDADPEGTNTPILQLDGKGSTQIPTTYYPFPGRFLSGSLTVCSWARGDWKCAAPISIYQTN